MSVVADPIMSGQIPVLPKKVYENVMAEMYKPEAAPLSRWKAIVAVLMEAGIAVVRKLHPKDVLCHPQNRGGLGLNHYAAHRNGLHIKIAGGDLNELNKKASCIEIAPFGPTRDQALDFNKKLVQLSGGMFANVTEKEIVLSISCGHTAAFCKAVGAGCITPYAKLSSSNTAAAQRLSKESVCGEDLELTAMVDQGWDWVCIPWWVDRQIPQLASFGQKR